MGMFDGRPAFAFPPAIHSSVCSLRGAAIPGFLLFDCNQCVLCARRENKEKGQNCVNGLPACKKTFAEIEQQVPVCPVTATEMDSPVNGH